VRRSAAALALLACLLHASSAGAGAATGIQFGVADDTGKYAGDSGRAFFDDISAIGLGIDRMTVTWDAAHPTTIAEAAFLDRAIPAATTAGVSIRLSVRPAGPAAVGMSAARAAAFAAFTAELAQRYPQVRTFVIGNEPNQPRFWRPQFRRGKAVAAAGYERMLADSYDALKRVDPTITVVGGVVSSRGNDSAAASSNSSTSPLRFIAGLGAAYRASHRTKPIMDVFGFHPYPRSNRDPLERGLEWPDAGFANIDRIKQAFWDAFAGTRQPTVEQGLHISIDEVGWQTAIPLASQEAYTGAETVAVTSDRAQANVYRSLIARAKCDPTISDVLFMPFVDENDLAGFQSGLERADGTKRPSYGVVRDALEAGTACGGKLVRWQHRVGVAGARAFFGPTTTRARVQRSWGFRIRAAEDTTWTASVVAVEGRRQLTAKAALAVRPVLHAKGVSHAGWTPRVVFPLRRLPAGRYAYVVVLHAALAPQRTTTLVGKTFSVR
jgi:hypothetical protein